ncbi:TetR/AcrR family transcriptional regulator [Cohnella hashimotonis]|uniref:TetR/AcrR family transcriptional regulator n=1 Tax=Cohnella hashimotonis TaxID=2826895 RepID=A0ABT6TCF8_9BACL|nr:TetR/AcrR family transcriptional regulator [Cohnella hashimotonis]MDI4644505.1 TetR/AcrR family transcriptional regulator [Cohnella hashimotonis]
MIKQNLRDMKKEATAHALADAAYELALERGLDGFVVDDIAQRAGYSRRTFANHFSCKEEAVVMSTVTFKENHKPPEQVLAAIPPDAPPLDTLQHLLKLRITAEMFRKLRTLLTMSKEAPTLEPYILSLLRKLQFEAQTILSELSRGRYPESYAHLLAGAMYGIMLPLIDGSLNVFLPGETAVESAEAMTFEQYLDTAFNHLRKGF